MSVYRQSYQVEAVFASNLAQAVRADSANFARFLQPLVGLGNKPPAEFRERAYVEAWGELIQRRKRFYELARQEQNRFAAENSSGKTCIADLTDVFDGNPDGV